MKVINRSNNTLYANDIDCYLPYEDEQIIEIDPDRLKKSKDLRSFVLNGFLDVIEYDEEETIESALMYMKRKRVEKFAEKIAEEGLPSEEEDLPDPPSLNKVNDDIEVKIHGIFYDDSGYGKVNRNLAMKLSDAGFKVRVSAKNSKNKLGEDDLRPILELEKNRLSKNHIRIDSIVPSFAEMATGKYSILYTTIESYTVPKQFIECCQLYNEIWLTSPWSAEILKKYVDKPIYVIPAGVDEKLYKEEGQAFNLRPNINDFVFISVFGWGYRKGYDVLLKAYFDEFSRDDNVSLLIVSKYQGNSSRFHRNKIKEDIEKIMSQFPNKDLPHVVRHSQIVPEKDMPKMYRAANCFVLPSRGEGSCCVPGTKIITDKGLVDIEKISAGDRVLSHSGTFQNVTETMNRYVDESVYSISTYMNYDEINVTKEHPILILKRKECHKNGKKQKEKFTIDNCKWTTPDNIDVGDYVVMPTSYGGDGQKAEINLTQYLNNENITIDNHKIYRKARNQYGSEFKHPNCTPINQKVYINNEFMRFLGLYIAEGWSGYNCKKNTGGVYFAFHKDEQEYIDFVCNFTTKTFGSQLVKKAGEKGHENRMTLSCNNTLLSELVSRLAGCGAHHKHLPDFIWDLEKNLKISLLQGIFEGDGSFYKNQSSPSLSLSTVSETLCDEVMLLLRSVGFSPCKQNKKKRGFTVSIQGQQLNDLKIKGCCFTDENRIVQFSVKTDGYIYLPVKEIKKTHYSGQVFNLEIETDHSYTTNCFTVHNCLPPVEASLCGLPVIMTNCSGQQMYLRSDNSYPIDIDYLEEIQRGQMHIHYWDGQKFPALRSPVVIESLKEAMRSVYSNYTEAQKKNRRLQQFVLSNFTWTHSANKAVERLRQINECLKGQ